MRQSGILMHISSLPSPYGIGTLGREAYKFADFLSAAQQSCWELLPIGPTSFGDSPYQSFSSFAGNPYFIDLDTLVEEGLLTKAEIDEQNFGDDPRRVDYGLLYRNRRPLLEKAVARLMQSRGEQVRAFAAEKADRLADYALYMAVKDHFGGKPWTQWPEDIRRAHISENGESVLAQYRRDLSQAIEYHIAVQYLFFTQWRALRAYAHEKGLKFIGDVPIYVPMDSADVWSAPRAFQFDENLAPVEVSGVPPDAFSADGQLWGNPLYDWDEMKKDGFAWWLKRLAAAAENFDVVRIDHFRGLAGYWAVPGGAETAREGRWREGPGKPFIDAVKKALPEIGFIAEDLGFLTPDVYELLQYSQFPGIKVMEFAFDSREPSDYLPHNYSENCVCFTGTHDNETLTQWLAAMAPADYEYARDYLGLNEAEGLEAGVIRGGMSSVAQLFLAQMQDWLALGGEARMNTPGTLGQNWKWRMDKDALTEELTQKIAKMTRLYGRSGR